MCDAKETWKCKNLPSHSFLTSETFFLCFGMLSETDFGFVPEVMHTIRYFIEANDSPESTWVCVPKWVGCLVISEVIITIRPGDDGKGLNMRQRCLLASGIANFWCGLCRVPLNKPQVKHTLPLLSPPSWGVKQAATEPLWHMDSKQCKGSKVNWVPQGYFNRLDAMQTQNSVSFLLEIIHVLCGKRKPVACVDCMDKIEIFVRLFVRVVLWRPAWNHTAVKGKWTSGLKSRNFVSGWMRPHLTSKL